MAIPDAREWLENYPEPLRIRDGLHKRQIVIALRAYAAEVLRYVAKEDFGGDTHASYYESTVAAILKRGAEELEKGGAR